SAGTSTPTGSAGSGGSSGAAGTAGAPTTPSVPSSGNTVLDDARAYNLQAINAIRAKANLPAYTMDAKLNDFAQKASEDLASTNAAHRYFSRNANSCQCSLSAENQGDPSGWSPGDVKKQIDEILDLMMSEGPGGGHHDNIVSRQHTKIGVGIVNPGGRMYFTNDFGR
ncbi:MAG: CAP domain-containing protein, partial [Polyangiaceae bacterium]